MSELTIEKLVAVSDELNRQVSSCTVTYWVVNPNTLYLFRVENARFKYKRKSRLKRIWKNPLRYILGKVKKCLRHWKEN